MRYTIEADTRENAAHAAWWLDRELGQLENEGKALRNFTILLPDGSSVEALESMPPPPPLSDSLSTAKARVVQAIIDLTFQQGYAPTILELCSELDLSKGTVHRHIADLRSEGWLEGGESPRTLKVMRSA